MPFQVPLPAGEFQPGVPIRRLDKHLILPLTIKGAASGAGRWGPASERRERGGGAPATKNVLSVNEIFYSIQGESTYAGKPCVFVRLAGCDLRCTWCDTAYAFNEGQKMSVDDVVQQVDRYGSPLVEVTGGEPLIQDRADYEFARDIVTRHALDRRCAAVLFSPVHGVMNPKDLSEWILEDHLPVRLQLQIHKHIWGANVRGV